MQKQHRQYVILVVVLLACAASVFFGVRSILHSNDEVTTFSVGDWEGITLPRYYGPAVYPTSQRSMATVTLPMTSTSSRSLFHHSVAPSYRAAVATTQQVHTSNATYRVHQTSDQVTRYVGAGNSSGGSASFSTSNVQQTAPSTTFSIPTLAVTTLDMRTRTQVLAVNNINMATTSSTMLANDGMTTVINRKSRIRRTAPSGEGLGQDDYGTIEEKDGETWFWDGEQWINKTPIGTTKIVDGKVYEWDGSDWVYKGDQAEPDAPIGDIPWLMLLIALIAYSTCRVIKKKENR